MLKSVLLFTPTAVLVPWELKLEQVGAWDHTKAVNYSTVYLATKIMMVMKIPTVMGKDHLQYASHLAVLV